MSAQADRPRRILVLEDDEDIARALARGLRREGYEPLLAADLETARAVAAGDRLDAAVIDVMLGEADGTTLVRDLRAAGSQMPIILLSALSGVSDRAAGLAAGADDYVAKPFDFADLLARIQVQEHRRAGSAPARLRLGALTLQPDTRQVTAGTRTVTLTERETLLLAELLRNPGRILSRQVLIGAVWKDLCGSENVVDVYIGYLRRKLVPPAAFGVQIRTVRGRGFTLVPCREGDEDA